MNKRTKHACVTIKKRDQKISGKSSLRNDQETHIRGYNERKGQMGRGRNPELRVARGDKWRWRPVHCAVHNRKTIKKSHCHFEGKFATPLQGIEWNVKLNIESRLKTTATKKERSGF